MATLLDMLQAKAPQQAPMARNTALEQTAQDIRYSPALRPSPERERRRGPSLLDTIWGVAAGYSPGDTRRRISMAEMDERKASMDLEAAQQAMSNRANIMSQITDPMERAIAMANPGKWAEFRGEREIKPHSLARGAQLRTGEGQLLAANNFTHQLGDFQIVVIDPQTGAEKVYQRDDLSPDEIAAIENQNIKRQEMAQQRDLTREGYAVQREGQQIERDKVNYDRLVKEEDREKDRATTENSALGRARALESDAQTITNGISTIKRNSRAAGVYSPMLPWNKDERANLEQGIADLKSVFSFDRLQRMRDNSPTGGALGGIAVEELRLLASTVGGIDPNMGWPEIERRLERAATIAEQMGLDASTLRQTAGTRTPTTTPGTRTQRAASSPAAPSAPRVGQTATNPSTGARIRWNGSAWEPA